LVVDVLKRVSLFGGPSLLVTGLTTVIFWQWGYRTRPLGVVRLEVAFVDAPSTPLEVETTTDLAGL